MTIVDTVCARLKPKQRDAIIAKFCKLNPHWNGAGVEDIIDALDQADGSLAEVEDAWDQFAALRQPGFGPAVRALVWSGTDVTEANLKALLD